MQVHCSLVIDGYNVLFQTPLMVAEKGTYIYELSRKRLVAFVELAIAKEKLIETVIVFDSKQQRTAAATIETQSSGLQVVFASNYSEADQYIEDLVIGHAKPRSLKVVSGDGKIKSTAKSYGAECYGARDWFERTLAVIPQVDRGWIFEGVLPTLDKGSHKSDPQMERNVQKKHPDPDIKNRAMRDLQDIEWSKFEDFDDVE